MKGLKDDFFNNCYSGLMNRCIANKMLDARNKTVSSRQATSFNLALKNK
jgi:hypothetical protein